MSETGELTGFQVALYRAALADSDVTVAKLADLLAATSDEVDKAVARLAEFGLVRYGDGDVLIAVSPMLAEATVLGAEDLELGARRAAIERRRDTIRRLVPMWNAVSQGVLNENHVDVISDQSEIANVLMHYADRCEEELLSVAPGRLASTRIDGRTRRKTTT